MIPDAKFLELALDWFHGCKSWHATACNEVNLGTIEVRMLPSRISINKKNQKWHLDGEVVYQFGQFAFGSICKSTTWTGIAQSLNVGVHSRHVIMQTNKVKCTIAIEMSANCIWVKRHKDDIVKFCWDKLKADYEDPPWIGSLKINMSSLITIRDWQRAAR